jgi:hypothetical protein
MLSVSSGWPRPFFCRSMHHTRYVSWQFCCKSELEMLYLILIALSCFTGSKVDDEMGRH